MKLREGYYAQIKIRNVAIPKRPPKDLLHPQKMRERKETLVPKT